MDKVRRKIEIPEVNKGGKTADSVENAKNEEN